MFLTDIGEKNKTSNLRPAHAVIKFYILTLKKMCVSVGYSVFEGVLRLKILPCDLHCYLMVYRLKTDFFGKGMLSSTLMDLMVLKSPPTLRRKI